MRYVGQGHEIPIPLPNRPLEPGDREGLRVEFERIYAEMFARFIPTAAIEILTWTVTVSTPRVPPAPLGPTPPARAAAPSARRPVFDPERGESVEVPAYWRPDLVPGDCLDGPAVIAEDETSTFVASRFRATINAAGCIVLDKRA
jgi:N-methylhydantoinase A